MKILPDNPNLDHLRRQAKELLAGLRESDSSVTLALAQALLAEQYGFRRWTDLKAEVDRRSGSAETADAALALAVARRFGLGDVTGPMRSVARPDHLGHHWSLRTSRGQWSVRTLENWWPIVDVESEVALQEAAAGAGILLPTPVRSPAGAIVEEIDGQRMRVHEWRHGGPPMAAPASAEVTATVGTILATLHGFRLPVDRVSPWHARRFSALSWAELAEQARAARADWAPELEAVVPTLTEFDDLAATPPEADPVLSHNALGPGQVSRGEAGRLVVAGWEHAGGQPPDWELAEALLSWTVDRGVHVNATAAAAMVWSYSQTANRAPKLELSTFAGAVTGLANYVSGQVYLALETTDPDEQAFMRRNVRHLLTHLPRQSTLDQILDAVAAPARR